MKINAVLEPSDEGGYTAYVPSLPDASAKAKTSRRPRQTSTRLLGSISSPPSMTVIKVRHWFDQCDSKKSDRSVFRLIGTA